MAGIITKIEIQKNNKERVNIHLDGQYAFPMKLSAALELKKGQQLTDADIAQLTEQDERHKAYDRAIFYLGFRARSQTEVETYLRDKDFSEAAIAEAVAKLTEQGYLDDEAFAEAWVADRQRLKPKGRRALRYELRQKGLSEAAMSEALAEVDEETAAVRALQKKVRQWRKLDETRFKKKALGFLSRRGFDFYTSREVTEAAWQQLQSD